MLCCAEIVYYIYVTQDGMTALMSAAYYGRMNIVRVLLAAGADIDLQNKVSADLHAICLIFLHLHPTYIYPIFVCSSVL